MKKTVSIIVIAGLALGAWFAIAGLRGASVSPCPDVKTLNWADRAQTLNQLEACYQHFLDTPAADKMRPRTDIDPLLYLAYIYLSPGQYQDTARANAILTHAMREMARDCDGWHGDNYENFCYLVGDRNIMAQPVNYTGLDENAMELFHLTLPCVHVAMIDENPAALDLLTAYFGSSRDMDMPRICAWPDPFKITHIDELRFDDEFYENVLAINKFPWEEGTIRWAFAQDNYHAMVEMLLFPRRVFGDGDAADAQITVNSLDENDGRTFYAQVFVDEIRRHKKLSAIYDKMLADIADFYVKKHGMSGADAARYARLTAGRTILLYVYYSCPSMVE